VNDPQGLNLYSYTRNSPTNLIDPDGREYKHTYNRTTKTITLKADVLVTGSNAAAVAAAMQNFVDAKLNGKHRASNGVTVNVDVNVTSDPSKLRSTAVSSTNVMQVDDKSPRTQVADDGKTGKGNTADLMETTVGWTFPRSEGQLYKGGGRRSCNPSSQWQSNG
jgi:hypothetical protein